MGVSYNRLWKMLIDKNMKRIEMQYLTGISGNILARMGKNQYVSMETIEKICKKLDCTVDKILLTHGHFDHIGGVAAVKAATGAKVVISAEDAPMLTSSRKSLAAFSFLSQAPAQADILVQDGDTVTLGNTVFTVLATPGHTPGGVCYITEHCIFSGDTLFFCSCGRTDFPGGSSREIMDSLQKLAALPGDYTVYPGHDRFSTLNFERQHNPYMKKL